MTPSMSRLHRPGCSGTSTASSPPAQPKRTEDGVLEQQAARLRQLTARQGQQQARLLDAYQQGVITLDELAARREQVARLQADIAAQLAQLEHEQRVRAEPRPAAGGA